MTNISMNEVNSALTDFRAEFDKKSQDLGKIKKIEKILDAQEEASQKATSELLQAKKNATELEEKFNNLEAELKRSPLGSDEATNKKAELKSFENFVCKGKDFITDVDKKYLRTDVNDQGGYLVPIAQESEMIKKITEISPIRSIAKVRTMPTKLMRMPVRSALISSSWVGEGQSNNSSQSSYGREELVAKKLSVTAIITAEELQDASPNMVSEINADVAEEFARAEGAEFVNGNGTNTPEGFMINSSVAEINSGDASTLSFDNFASLEGELKTGYDAVYGFNRKTLAIVRNLKDGSGAYIWRAGNLGAGVPNTINGTSYIEVPDMPDVGAGLYPVIYGDFAKGYLIGDRLGFTVIRDDVTLASEDKVKFTFKKRLDGQVILPEAFVKLKISV